jgi:hypothetical protein
LNATVAALHFNSPVAGMRFVFALITRTSAAFSCRPRVETRTERTALNWCRARTIRNSASTERGSLTAGASIMIRRKLLTFVAAVFAIAIGYDPVCAADATMPIMFVGDWCYGSVDNRTTNYTLPSWTEGGLYKNILSISPCTFYAEKWHREPMQVRQRKDCAPSGCAYVASVIARCQPDGPVTSGTRKLFEFSRYKGNLYVTEK